MVSFQMSQSPQAGQFNSYPLFGSAGDLANVIVSIPSSGSIQFLRFPNIDFRFTCNAYQSQSPQAGQFNSYLYSYY